MPDKTRLRAMPEPTVLRALLLREHLDRYVFTSGPLSGTTGYFERGQNNRVRALHLFGRWLPSQGIGRTAGSVPPVSQTHPGHQ